MARLVSFLDIKDEHRNYIGGKALSLSKLIQSDSRVPRGAVIPTKVYREYVRATGLDEKIQMALTRYPVETIRWEQMWDIALTIRNYFINTPMPPTMETNLTYLLNREFRTYPLAVRSSAPMEDSAGSSFAGIHESYVMLNSIEDVLKSIRLVWASLWSDRAIMYRKELKLNPLKSTMAVIVQEMIEGNSSGIAFTVNPTDSKTSVIEAVYGLNQGLVDGSVMADRWIIDRNTSDIVTFTPADRTVRLGVEDNKLRTIPLTASQKQTPPLKQDELMGVFLKARNLETFFESPQDVEWTVRDGDIYVLQSRPITKLPGDDSKDVRNWYKQLRISKEQLVDLIEKAEKKILPGMEKEADILSKVELEGLDNAELIQQIIKRKERLDYWKKVYYKYLIPMAHGPRLLGEVYNDKMQPKDPFEFTRLLTSTEMDAVKRNRALFRLVEKLKQMPELKHSDLTVIENSHNDFYSQVKDFAEQYGAAVLGHSDKNRMIKEIYDLLGEWSDASIINTVKRSNINHLEKEFLNTFSDNEKEDARQLINIARITYKLRDDDNLYLAKVEFEFKRAVEEARHRIAGTQTLSVASLPPSSVVRLLKNPEDKSVWKDSARSESNAEFSVFSARQLTGQPASAGLATGRDRVVSPSGENLKDIKSGEIIVCDAIDPKMTFAIPMCAGIVERRGGMLIHGAIIAREYQIPCITGVTHAVNLIHTGDLITIDGYTGIVTIKKHHSEYSQPLKADH